MLLLYNNDWQEQLQTKPTATKEDDRMFIRIRSKNSIGNFDELVGPFEANYMALNWLNQNGFEPVKNSHDRFCGKGRKMISIVYGGRTYGRITREDLSADIVCPYKPNEFSVMP